MQAGNGRTSLELRRGGVRAFFASVAVLLAGCGAELYEERLADTRAMFAHQDQLNQNLSGAWGDPQTGINLRAPLQFRLLAPPAKPVAPDGASGNAPAKAAKQAGAEEQEQEESMEDEVIDDRQPDYLNIELPGLRGAFKASLKYVGGSGDGFLYVMSNQHLAEQPDQARDFEKQFVQSLGEALHVDADKWNEDRFPPEGKAKASFVKSLPYKDLVLTSSEEIAGYVREFSVYMYDQGDIQVIVLFVLPKDVDSSEKMNDRIPLCLETLVVTGDKLVIPTAGTPAVSGAQPGGF